jgi:hypothetical protein
MGKPHGKTTEKIYIGLEDSTGMEHREIGWRGMDFIETAQDRDQWRALVNRVMNLRVA